MSFEVPEHVRPVREAVEAFMRERVEPAEPQLHAGDDSARDLLRDLQRQAK
jgi:acyl-CoA dehydrogenase